MMRLQIYLTTQVSTLLLLLLVLHLRFLFVAPLLLLFLLLPLLRFLLLLYMSSATFVSLLLQQFIRSFLPYINMLLCHTLLRPLLLLLLLTFHLITRQYNRCLIECNKIRVTGWKWTHSSSARPLKQENQTPTQVGGTAVLSHLIFCILSYFVCF